MSDDLPEGWALAALKDIVENHDGRRIPVKSSDRARRHGAYPYYGASGIIDSINDFLFDGTFLLVAEDGANLLSRSTPIAFPASGKFWVNNHAHVLRPLAELPLGYLLHFLNSFDLQHHVTGTAQPKLTQGALNQIEIPVAPLPEQRRIVEKVETLLEQVNRAKGRLERVPVVLKRFRQAVLAAACSGELTKEWRESRRLSDVDVLLSELARYRDAAFKAGRKQRELRDAEPLFDVPDEWRWTTLGHLAQIVGGVTKGQKRRPGERLRKVPYLRVANVQRGSLDLTEMKEIDATEPEIAELRLVPRDVLFTEGGDRDKLGRGWVWSGELSECIHQNHIFRARLYIPKIEAKFVSWFGNVFGKAYFDDEASQTVNLASINITKLSALPVPMPPPEEQVEIVHQVEKLFALADTIERRVHAATARADKLPQAILSKAFLGELVPTEAELARADRRTYETAEELLARVRASGQTNGAATKKGPRTSAKRGRARQARAE